MNDKIKFVLPAQEPSITAIIPYGGEEHQFNEISLCENDEAFVVEGKGIGEAQIAGAENAKNEWLVFMDADAIYPEDYISQIKNEIQKTQDVVLVTKRKGGFGDTFAKVRGSNLAIRKGIFLDKAVQFKTKFNGRTDFSFFPNVFSDAHKIPIEYHHDLTTLETLGSSVILIGTGLAAIGAVAFTEFKKRSYI